MEEVNPDDVVFQEWVEESANDFSGTLRGSDVYEEAVRCLSSTENVVGREKEIYQILHFCEEAIVNRKPGSLYVSGIPGVGKVTSACFKVCFFTCITKKGFFFHSLLQ